MTTNQLMKFIESLYERGLLSVPLDKFDYEWVCYDYINSLERGFKIDYLNKKKEMLNIEYQILKKQENEND